MVVFTGTGRLLTLCALMPCVLYVIGTSSIEMDQVRRILFQYYLACGPSNICNKSLIEKADIADISLYNQEKLHTCPQCSCDEDSCLVHRNCCPDIYFTKVSKSCRSFIVSPKLKKSDTDYLVIDSCPTGAPSYLLEACLKEYSPLERLHHPPVTSNTTGLLYQNDFCARCNSDFLTEPWPWYVKCRDSLDFNFLSSYSELLQKADSNDCLVEYGSFKLGFSQCRPVADESRTINKCNISRTWTKWNPDILKGCESGYEHRFGFFKNVFCHLCNPPLQMDNAKLICKSNTDKENLVAACKNLPSLESFGANKNGFCLACNGERTKEGVFLDLNATVDEQYNSKGFFEYNVKVQSFHENYIIQVIEECFRKPKYLNGRKPGEIKTESRVTEDTGSVMLRVNDNQLVNLTNLVQKYFALEPKKICNEDLLPPNLIAFATSGCSCDPACLFTDSCNCCVDTSLLSSTKCLSDKVFSTLRREESNFLTTNTCQNRGLDPTHFRIISDYCKSEDVGVLSIPVYHKSSGITYRNIFCLMCNEPMSMSSVLPVITDRYKIWDIKLSCSRRIESRQSTRVNDLILLGKRSGCDIQLIPKTARRCPKYDEGMITKCNVTGHWMEQDKDIQWACENVSASLLPPYADRKNVFCNLCNPDQKYGDNITSKCNSTGNWLEYDSIMDQGCQQLPFIQNSLLYPFKNDFCAFCNGYDVPHYITPSMYCRNDFGVKVGRNDTKHKDLRPVSTVNIFPNEPLVYHIEGTTSIFDPVTRRKRDIHCYPGRHLVRNDCIALIKKSIYLRYSLTLALEGHLKGEGQRMLRMLKETIFVHIREKMKINTLDIQVTYLMSNLSCESTMENNSVRILFHGSFYLKGPVDRNKVEQVLFDLHQPSDNVSLKSEYYNLTIVHSKAAYNIPTIINSGRTRQRCFLADQNDVKVDAARTIFVSKMLLCKQIQFHKNEFSYDEVHMKLQLKQFNKTFHNEEFYVTSEGDMRICLEDFMSVLSNVRTSSLSTKEQEKSNNRAGTLLMCSFVQYFVIMIFSFFNCVIN